MNRRGFLGSLFGMVAAAPFLFKTINDPIQRVKLPYNAFIRESSGLWIQAPEVSTIEKIENGWKLIVEPLLAKNTVVYDGCMIQTSSGIVVFENRFEHGPLKLGNGDTLNLSYALTGNSQVGEMTLERMVEHKILHKRGQLV